MPREDDTEFRPDVAPNEEVEALYRRIEELERQVQSCKDEHPDDGYFKPCGNKACPNKVQVGIRYCPPCRGAG